MHEMKRSRLTVVDNVYFQDAGGQPSVVSSRFNTWLESEDQPCPLKLRLTQEWVMLSKSWLTECSMILVEHLGEVRSTNPTEEEKALDASKVVEVAYDGLVVMRVLPGQSARFCPVELMKLSFRSNATTKCNVTVFPK